MDSQLPATPAPDALVMDPEGRYSCHTCGRCCKANWDVVVPDDKKREIEARPWSELGRTSVGLFKKSRNGLWLLTKKPGTTTCIMLGDDNLCILHKQWGEESKPIPCRQFPFIPNSSPDHVWVTVDYGCKAVQERSGKTVPEHAPDIQRMFSAELSQAHPEANTRYALTASVEKTSIELDALFNALFASLGDRLFPALRQLAAFVAAAPELGTPEPAQRPTTPKNISGEVRYAFSLSLYSDAIDRSSFWGRIQGALVMPKLLSFQHTYQSRLLKQEISMPAVLAHPGHIPPESEAILLMYIRARIRSRMILRDVPFVTAGITRLLLWVDAVLYFARAQAIGRTITHKDVLKGLEVVELFMANQGVIRALAEITPQLPRFWQNPAVALGAAQMFVPVEAEAIEA